MYKPQKIERLGELSPEQYIVFSVKVADLHRRDNPGLVAKVLALALHKEKEENRRATLNERPADYDGLADFFNMILQVNTPLLGERDIDEEAKQTRLGKALHDTKTYFGSGYPPGDSLYQWMAMAFSGYDATGRLICQAISGTNSLNLREKLLTTFKNEVRYDTYSNPEKITTA